MALEAAKFCYIGVPIPTISDFRLLVGGSMNDIGGNAAADQIAKINLMDLTSPDVDELEGGFNGAGRDILVHKGVYYFCGSFTTGAGRTLNFVASYRGQRLEAMGSGIGPGPAYALGVFRDKIIVGGEVDDADDKTLPGAGGVAEWTGYQWVAFPLSLPGAGRVRALANDGNDGLIVGGDFVGTVVTEAITTVTPGGDTSTRPRIVFVGPGTVHRLTNYTTGDTLYFELPLLAGETATLDLTRELHADANGDQTRAITFVSTRVGNIISTIMPGSNESTFRLVAGANLIGLFIDDATAGCTMYYRKNFLTVDSLH